MDMDIILICNAFDEAGINLGVGFKMAGLGVDVSYTDFGYR